MVEPVAGILGALAIVVAEPLLPYSLAFAAGAMIYVVVDDIIPEAQMWSVISIQLMSHLSIHWSLSCIQRRHSRRASAPFERLVNMLCNMFQNIPT